MSLFLYRRSTPVETQKPESNTQTYVESVVQALSVLATIEKPVYVYWDMPAIYTGKTLDKDIAYTYETMLRIRGEKRYYTHTRLLVHSLAHGVEAAILYAIQSPTTRPTAAEELGALADEERIIDRLVEMARENVRTENSVLRWNAMHEPEGPCPGTYEYRASAELAPYQGIRIVVEEEGIDEWITSTRQYGVHPLELASEISRAGDLKHHQNTTTYSRRWATGMPSPTPVRNPEVFSRELVRLWRYYRSSANEALKMLG